MHPKTTTRTRPTQTPKPAATCPKCWAKLLDRKNARPVCPNCDRWTVAVNAR